MQVLRPSEDVIPVVLLADTLIDKDVLLQGVEREEVVIDKREESHGEPASVVGPRLDREVELVNPS